jgi:pentatricopeptide repeat protein
MRQACGVWACRSLSLQGFYSEAVQMLEEMEAAGVQVVVEHIYREFNKSAFIDGLAL